MKKYLSWKLIAILLVTIFLAFYNLPSGAQQAISSHIPKSITDTKIHLGLDLQGGSQLDYKIDLRKVEEGDRESIVEGVLGVIEKRVNGLGVAEPNIYTSTIADETHIIVEIADTATISQEDVDTYLGKEGKKVGDLTDDEKKLVSLEKAKATVGKTILLEFKEERTEEDPEEENKVRANAKAALDRIKGGENFSVVGQEEQQAFPGKVRYETSEYLFENKLLDKLKEPILSLEAGEVYPKLIETGGTFTLDEYGNFVEETGLGILKLTEVTDGLRDEKQVFVSHILISWSDLETAPSEIERTEDEALKLAEEIKEELANGKGFATLAQEYSDDLSNKESGGKLEDPVTGDGTYVATFEEAALAMTKADEVSDIIKTEFGYHILKANEVRDNVTETQYKYELITYSLLPDPWQDTGLTGEHFIRADVQLDNFYQPYITILFNDEGGELFEEITGRNIGKKVAIFVGGQLISSPNVNEKIAGGSAQIIGEFTMEEAQALARDLNTGAIPAPIVLTGEYTIGATLGHDALTKSLWAGSIGLLLVMIFMLLFYRLPGLVADAALIVYACIFLFLLKSQMHLGLALGIALIVFGFLVFKIVNNKDSGWEKLLSFLLACVGFFFMTFLLKTGVVLTLAGVAGIILSIGMAVDANILIFERFKEELRSGKTYAAAIESGFDRAWSAIRDSNFSTLLICAILFSFGTSIIKGFAFTLAAGVLVSMFTAITITKTLLQGFIGKKIAENEKALGLHIAAKERKFSFTKNSRKFLTSSLAVIIIAIISMFAFGLNLGMDFTGGTLLEFKFQEEVTKENLSNALSEIGGEINDSLMSGETEGGTDAAPTGSIMLSSTEDPVEKVDLDNIKILSSGENDYVVKTKYLTSEIHDELVAKMKERLPEFTEPRFTTVGPVIGSTMLISAVKAILIALLVITIYLAFAFRKIPKEVSPWRFGATAIIALLHDVIIITGLFVILGQFLNVELDALFVTAMLTVLGYSVNDTIVIFDRIRDNLIHEDHQGNIAETADKALNQTFTRSVNTSLSTLFTLIAVLLLGSSSIFYFILALTLGTIVGTYSSIFIASPILVKWSNWALKRKYAKSE